MPNTRCIKGKQERAIIKKDSYTAKHNAGSIDVSTLKALTQSTPNNKDSDNQKKGLGLREAKQGGGSYVPTKRVGQRETETTKATALLLIV